MVKVLASYLANLGSHLFSTKNLFCGLGWITKSLIIMHLWVPNSQTQIFSTLNAVLLEPMHLDYHPLSLLLLGMCTTTPTLSTCTTPTVQPQGNIYQIPHSTTHWAERCVEMYFFYMSRIEKIGTFPTDVLSFTFFPAQFNPLTFLEIFLSLHYRIFRGRTFQSLVFVQNN